MLPRKSFDYETYVKGIQTNPCFVCQIVAGEKDGPAHIVYENEEAIVFLNKYPTLYGYTLVAPKVHKEQVTADFTLQEYLSIQKLIYAVAEATRKCVNPERVYILSLGSQQANRHVHWHIAPLPFGVPFEEQQCNAIRFSNGILDLSDEEMSQLATRLRAEIRF
jgi:diadenosine tetraphosphate (Ap4A) HIT family hydrolase